MEKNYWLNLNVYEFDIFVLRLENEEVYCYCRNAIELFEYNGDAKKYRYPILIRQI